VRTTRHQFWLKYQAVIFDCDDTLTQSIKIRSKALLHVARELQIDLDEKRIRAAWGKPFDEFIAILFPGIDFQLFLERYEVAREQYKAIAAAGVPQLLTYLSHLNKHMEIVTSTQRRIIVQDLQSLGLLNYFANIWGHEETTPFSKPDPRVLSQPLANLESLGYIKANILYIGDSVSDFRVAHGNKVEFVAVTTGIENKEQFLREGLPSSKIKASMKTLIPRCQNTAK